MFINVFMSTKHFEKVIDELVKCCGSNKTKADLARRIGELFPNANIRLQDINNWRKRGIPVAKVSAISREFDYPEHMIRPDSFLPPPDAAAY